MSTRSSDIEGEPGVIVRMWEAQAHPEGFADLLSWICEVELPHLEHEPLYISGEVYSSTDHRVVVITKWRGSAPVALRAPARHLITRNPQTWDFTQVDR